ncbi:MAG: hypothetical protein ACXADH_04425 [Candidatus Kariarchaeaceae archaeon]
MKSSTVSFTKVKLTSDELNVLMTALQLMTIEEQKDCEDQFSVRTPALFNKLLSSYEVRG